MIQEVIMFLIEATDAMNKQKNIEAAFGFQEKNNIDRFEPFQNKLPMGH